jgi:hypothetical protein
MARPLLYGANNEVLVVDVGPQERINALLCEVFGVLIGYKGSGPKPLPVQDVLKIIVDILGVEMLEERYAGLKLEVTRRPHAAGSES